MTELATLGRAVPEWKGRTPDSKIPDHVRLRILLRYDRRCYLSGREIRPGDDWDAEHVRPLSMGGQHRESNLAPALKAPHRDKTKQDVKRKAKADAAAKRAYGITRAKRPMQSRGFTVAEKQKKDPDPFPTLPRGGNLMRRFADAPAGAPKVKTTAPKAAAKKPPRKKRA